MVYGRQHEQRFWNELCLSQVRAMASWSTNKTVCVTCVLGTEVVDETHTHTYTYYRFLGSGIWSELQ
jgi:hypothetical protein